MYLPGWRPSLQLSLTLTTRRETRAAGGHVDAPVYSDGAGLLRLPIAGKGSDFPIEVRLERGASRGGLAFDAADVR